MLDLRSSQGIALQICDVFIPELGKVDSNDISLTNISGLLDPFLQSLAKSSSKMPRVDRVTAVARLGTASLCFASFDDGCRAVLESRKAV